MKKYVMAVVAIAVIFSACSKDDKGSAPQTQIDPTEYYPMTTGSYWVYEHFLIDSNGVSNTHAHDSIFVAGDTTINGKVYRHLDSETNFPLGVGFFRDSSGYLVNTTGHIVFAPNDFSDTLSPFVEMINPVDTLFSGYIHMRQQPVEKTVPAGTFEVLVKEENFLIKQGNANSKLQMLETRARQVGLISAQTAYINAPYIIEIRLLRYHIAP